jgi:hypothetical protein
MSGAKVKVLHNTVSTTRLVSDNLDFEGEELTLDGSYSASHFAANSLFEISIGREFAEKTLSVLRMNGFSREDIYRMLDKGPWIMAFNILKPLQKLFADLEVKV